MSEVFSRQSDSDRQEWIERLRLLDISLLSGEHFRHMTHPLLREWDMQKVRRWFLKSWLLVDTFDHDEEIICKELVVSDKKFRSTMFFLEDNYVMVICTVCTNDEYGFYLPCVKLIRISGDYYRQLVPLGVGASRDCIAEQISATKPMETRISVADVSKGWFNFVLEVERSEILVKEAWHGLGMVARLSRDIESEGVVYTAQMNDCNYCSKCGTKLTAQQKKELCNATLYQKQYKKDERGSTQQKNIQNREGDKSPQKQYKSNSEFTSQQKEFYYYGSYRDADELPGRGTNIVPYVEEQIGDSIGPNLLEDPALLEVRDPLHEKLELHPNAVRVVRSLAPSSPGSLGRSRNNSGESLARQCEGKVFDAQMNVKCDFSNNMDSLMECYKPGMSLKEFVFQAQIWNVNHKVDIGEDVKKTIDKLQMTMDNLVDKIPNASGFSDILSKATGGIHTTLKFITTSWPALFAWYVSAYQVGKNISWLLMRNGQGSIKRLAKWIGIYTAIGTWLFMTNEVLRKAVGEMVRLIGVLITAQYTTLVSGLSQKGWAYDSEDKEWRAPAGQSKAKEWNAQVNDDSGIMGKSASVVLTALCAQLVGRTPSDKKLEKFLSTVSMVPRASAGMTHAVDAGVEVFHAAVNFIREQMMGLKPLTWLDESFPDVDRWCAKVQSLAEEARSPGWRVNQSNGIRVFNLYKEGNALTLGKYKQVESARVRSAFQAYMGVLRKLLVPFEQANISGITPRMQPVTVFLTGCSGVGKSSLSIPLVTAVLAKVLPKEQREALKLNYMDFVYNRQTEHQYWDRYYGQVACIFDDFLQLRDTAGERDNELMDIIRCTNLFTNVLHMAALENKGNTCFTSRFILATSNARKINAESINEVEAVVRRFDFSYQVIPKEEYAITRNDDGTLLHETDRKSVV